MTTVAVVMSATTAAAYLDLGIFMPNAVANVSGQRIPNPPRVRNTLNRLVRRFHSVFSGTTWTIRLC
jgi:hypothetical protein